MWQNLIFILVFLDSIFISISTVQNWNFDKASIDLLSESNTEPVKIKVLDETTNNL